MYQQTHHRFKFFKPSMDRQRVLPGFTTIELMICIAVIVMLAALSLAVISQATREAKRITCAGNVHQIGVASQAYLNDYKETWYWRGDNVSFDGMDWYVYGGRESGNTNTGQNGLFNNTIPRPLNAYATEIAIFRCPHDIDPQSWAQGTTHFNYVGNSYTFNCIGHPLERNLDPDMGLAGRRLPEVHSPDKTVVYFDTSLHKSPGSWHGKSGNFALADGHCEFMALPDATDESYCWGP